MKHQRTINTIVYTKCGYSIQYPFSAVCSLIPFSFSRGVLLNSCKINKPIGRLTICLCFNDVEHECTHNKQFTLRFVQFGCKNGKVLFSFRSLLIQASNIFFILFSILWFSCPFSIEITFNWVFWRFHFRAKYRSIAKLIHDYFLFWHRK